MAAVFAGMISGVGCATLLILTNRDPFLGLNAGFFALCVNFAITVLASLLAPVVVGGLLPAEASEPL